jgi:hypothetical protein
LVPAAGRQMGRRRGGSPPRGSSSSSSRYVVAGDPDGSLAHSFLVQFGMALRRALIPRPWSAAFPFFRDFWQGVQASPQLLRHGRLPEHAGIAVRASCSSRVRCSVRYTHTSFSSSPTFSHPKHLSACFKVLVKAQKDELSHLVVAADRVRLWLSPAAHKWHHSPCVVPANRVRLPCYYLLCHLGTSKAAYQHT